MLLSTTQRVLDAPELLSLVFHFLDDLQITSNITVCKKWSDIALDILWSEVNDPYRIFSILAPLSCELMGDEYEFRRMPDSEDWMRFERYRRRVRRMAYHASSPTRILRQSVFDDIARTRTHIDIFPNMHTLEWEAPLPLCIMFMHSNIKRFHIHLPMVLKKTSPRPFFLDISTRMPNLSHLDIRTNVPMRCIEEDTVTLLSSLEKLEVVVLPQFSLTTKVFEALSPLTYLRVIEFQYFKTQGCGDVDDLVDFTPSLTQNSYPALDDFSANLNCTQSARLFQEPYAPRNLTTLYLDSRLLETQHHVSQLLNIISDNCGLLRRLSLMTFVDVSTVLIGPPDKEDCLNFDTLSPIFKLSHLRTFEISHHCPLDLTQADIVKLSQQLSSIETLFLNCEPAYIDDPTLTLHALLPIAENCRDIKELGLFVDASSLDSLNFPISIPSPSSSPSRRTLVQQPPSFAKLRSLFLGPSLISDPGPAASFLSQLCPVQCHLDNGVTWNKCEGTTAEIVRDRCNKWAQVEEMLPLLTSLRMEERRRAEALQKEVEDLRYRTTMLQDRQKVGGEQQLHDSCLIS